MRALRFFPIFFGLVVVLAGCPSTEEREEPPPRPAAAPPPAAPAAPPAAPAAPPAAPGPAPAPSAPPDYWVNRFGGYMSPEFKARYLATPEEKRFEVFGEKLLEFQRREALLDEVRDKLDRSDIEKYRALPDYESSVRFLEERAPK
jgi:hypothetical protein